MKKYKYVGSEIIRFTHLGNDICLSNGNVYELNESDNYVAVLAKTGQLEVQEESQVKTQKEVKS
jgi:hypothetical protein